MKKICVITGTRAEYGLLQPLLKRIKNDSHYTLQIIATGMHLEPEFGLTYRQIESDGYIIDEQVYLQQSSDSKVSTVKATGHGLLRFPDAYERLKPDVVVVLGDRYEILSATIAAYFMMIPVVHLYGGETTEGAIDEAIRHSITKMAHLHFTSTEPYRQRVIQLGESPDRVFNVGAIGIDNILELPLLSREELGQSLEIDLKEPYFLITYHPVTLSTVSEDEQLKEFFKALDFFSDKSCIITLPNSDAGGRRIIELINDYATTRDNIFVFTSLGQIRYLSAVKHAVAVLGNSSSGIVEVPSLHVPTVNIGERQKGRIAAASVIHCDYHFDGIKTGIEKALSCEFQKLCQTVSNPYGNGGSADKIFQILSVNIDRLGETKSFYDLS